MSMGEVYPTATGQKQFCEIIRKYREAAFTIINNAFGRSYTEEDILDMWPGRVMCVMSDRIRRYDFISVEGKYGSRLACLTESDINAGLLGNNPCCTEDTLWIEMCNIAIVRPIRRDEENGVVKCVIDSPGGVMDYTLPVVTVDESEPEFAELLKYMFED